VMRSEPFSGPYGLPVPVSWQDISVCPSGSIRIQFYQLRAVHIHFERITSTLWRVRSPKTPHPLLQSWIHEYPTWETLIHSVHGAKVLNPSSPVA
jgi:hypothetical protein